jgi:hypothetical protein
MTEGVNGRLYGAHRNQGHTNINYRLSGWAKAGRCAIEIDVVGERIWRWPGRNVM